MNQALATAAVNNRVSTCTLVSSVQYLAGVDETFFTENGTSLLHARYKELECNEPARVVRSLCTVRTALEENFGFINDAMRYQMKNLDTLPQYIPGKALRTLEESGITLVQPNRKTIHYIMDVNRHILDWISACKDLFPDWVNWNYIRELFIMPKGMTEKGVKQAAAVYNTHKKFYPYHIYLNWGTVRPDDEILADDKRFVTWLYAKHHERFCDFSKVFDVSEETKNTVYDFLERSERAVVVVDCENADPYKFFGMMECLDKRALLRSTDKIILYNDVHASSAWRVINRYADIPVEHIMTERVLERKSLVDIQLAAGVCREHYENNADSILLFSSDSDYLGLISMLPDLRFFVTLERTKRSPFTTDALERAGVPYGFSDDYCTASSNKLMMSALHMEFERTLTTMLTLNLTDVVEQALQAARVSLSLAEKERVCREYIRSLKIRFGDDGHPMVQLCK